MADSNFVCDTCAELIANPLAQSFSGTHGLFNNIHKFGMNQGEGTRSFKKVATGSATERAIGGALAPKAGRTITTVTIDPKNEIVSQTPIDRIDAGRSFVDILAANQSEIVTELKNKLDSLVWTAAQTFTTTVGSEGTLPDVSVLDLANAAMTDNLAWTDMPWFAVVGSAEMAAWAPALTDTVAGPLGVDAQRTGFIKEKSGFYIFKDQARPGTSGTDAVNIAMHPKGIVCGFRNAIDYIASQPNDTQIGSYTDPVTGLTIFVEIRDMNNSTTGVGKEIQTYIHYDLKVLDQLLGCRIEG